jgi:transcriptional regulator with XRE-family HTH domain
VQPVPPALLELAQRLRSLRTYHGPGKGLTQADLGKALGVAPATVSSWESPIAPKLPPPDRISAYACFFATPRSVEQGLLPLDSLTEQERGVYEELHSELLRLHNAARPSRAEAVGVRRSWHFADHGPATLVCAQLPKAETGSLADPADPNYTELLSYADLDALVELHGHIRAENPAMDVFYRAAPNVVTDDLSGHVILLGGVVWNDITKRLSELIDLPVKQIEDPSLESGEIFVANIDGKQREFFPKWQAEEHTDLVEDVGLLARVSNPLNSNRTLTICNGIHSRGVLGAVRSLTDARLRESNEGYIARHFGSAGSFIILTRVNVIQGKTMTPDFTIPDTVIHRWAWDAAK